MKHYISVFILALLFFNLSVNAQVFHSCGTTNEEQKTTYGFVQQQRQSEKQARSRNEVEEVPIKIHIIGAQSGAFAIDSSVVLEELELVNEAFEELDIVFTQCGPINYIFSNAYVTFVKTVDEVLCNIHDVEGAINIYIPPNVEKEDGEEICGYAYNFDIKPRLFLDKNCVTNGSTFIHELGHSFSLLHTHSTSNGEELANGSNCSTAGDLLCDTPADPRLNSDIVNDDCEYIGTVLDSQQNPYNPDTGNFMSYSRKECREYFSEEQKTQMENFYQERGFFLDCFDSPTSTHEADVLNAIKVFPNPSNNSIFLSQVPKGAIVELSDTAGRRHFQKMYDSVFGKLEIQEVSHLRSGIYFLTISTKGQATTHKIVRF